MLRPALDRLRAEGLILSHQRAGSSVRLALAAPVSFARVETFADIQRGYEFRGILQRESAQLAAERHNAAALAEIDRALDLLREATGRCTTARTPISPSTWRSPRLRCAPCASTSTSA